MAISILEWVSEEPLLSPLAGLLFSMSVPCTPRYELVELGLLLV
jgi:hypothetical protein